MRLRCGEEVRELVLKDGREGLEVSVDGTRFRPQVEGAGPGRFALRQGDSVELFHCVRDGDDIHLYWRGVAYRLVEEKDGGRTAQRHHAGGLEAPMPGKVIKVGAAVGQRVAKGDELLVIEAMKMENAVRAPREGVVTAVAARVGDMVSPGVVLVEIE